MIEAAPAKINLCLHVTGQRPDGYHLLDSLVVFADVGDVIEVRAAPTLSLRVIGPQARDLPVGEDNLVLRAARAVVECRREMRSGHEFGGRVVLHGPLHVVVPTTAETVTMVSLPARRSWISAYLRCVSKLRFPRASVS